MTAWIELLSRELAMLALLAAMGSGPVALLHRSHDRATRLALAPAYGLALGMCVLVTGLWQVPGYKLVWIGLVPLTLASLAVAFLVRRKRTEHLAPERGGTWQVAAVVGVVLLALSWPLATRDTTGPVGGYAIADAAGYTAEIDGAQERSIDAILDSPAPFADLTLEYWKGIAGGFQQIGYDAIESPAAELLGLHATDVLAPFLIAIMAVTALGIFAGVRMLSGTGSPLAVVAGWLAAGPLFIQLFMDGSQAALVGQALLIPLMLALHAAATRRRWRDLLLAGLMAAGLQTAYPLFVPPVVLGAVVVVAILLLRHRRMPRWALVGIPGLLLLAAALTPYAFSRNAEYWIKVANGEFALAGLGLPGYDLQAELVPGWILQTREFYDLLPPGDALLSGGLIPLALIALGVFGAVRHRAAAWLFVLVGACAVLALYTIYSEDCAYCVQRNLLPAAPVAATLVGVGLVALARASLPAALLAAVVLVVAVADKHEDESLRERNAAFLFGPDARDVLHELPQDGPVHLEGFGQGDKPEAEHAVTYHAVNEATPQPLSIVAYLDDGKSQQYIGGLKNTGPEFRLDWRYALTRHAAVDTGRRVVARSGPIAVEERRRPLDVTLEGGTIVAQTHVDKRGRAWLRPGTPLRMFVWGGAEKPAWVHIVLRETGTIGVKPSLDLDARRIRGGRIEICVQAAGAGPGRLAEVQMDQGPGPAPPAPEGRFSVPLPATGGYVESVRATERDCSPLRTLSPLRR